MRFYTASILFALTLPLGATPVTTFVSTGTDVTGDRDNKYQVVQTVTAGDPGTVGSIVYNTVPYDAYVTPYPPATFPVGVPGGWFSSDADSAWISPKSDQSTSTYDNIGEFSYQTQFSLTGFDPISVSLQFRVWADNTINAILLNGVATGFTLSNPINYIDPNAYTAVTLTGAGGGFTSGINTLTFVVGNTAWPYNTNVSGFRLKVDSADGTLCPVPEPSTFALMGLGLTLAGWAARRRKQA